MIEEKNIEVDGTSIHYREASPKNFSGTPIVFVHGFLVHSAGWKETMLKLALTHRVLALDLPGFGKSGYLPNKDAGIEKFAVVVNRFVAELGIDRAILVGHSMGGAIAIIACAMFKDRFVKGVFMGPAAYPFKGPLKARLPRIPILGALIFKKLYGWSMFKKYFRDDVFHNPKKMDIELIRDFYDSFNPPQRRDYMHRIIPYVTDGAEVSPYVSEITQPCLVIWGDSDALVPISIGERLNRELKDARFEIVADVGHEPFAESLEETVNLIVDFIR